MHLFFNDPRAAYVTNHRRGRVRRPMLTLVAGGVGVAALGVAIGAAGWEPPAGRQPVEARTPPGQQLGVVMPEPVVAVFDVPAAPLPVFGVPAPTWAAPRPVP